MKKILTMITLALVVALAGCNQQTKEYKTSIELMQEIQELKSVEGLENVRILGNSDEDKDLVMGWLSGESKFGTSNLIDGAVISPMMNVDARAVLILRFDGTENPDDVKAAMENFSRFLICVTIEDYEITNVGSTYIFSGVQDNTEVIDTFKALNFERELLTEESTTVDVLARTIEKANISLQMQTMIMNDEFSLGQLEYLVAEPLGFDTSVIKEAVLSYSYESDQLFAMFKTTDVEQTKADALLLNDFYIESMMKDFVLDGQVAVYGDYVFYTNSVSKEVLEEVVNNLK